MNSVSELYAKHGLPKKDTFSRAGGTTKFGKPSLAETQTNCSVASGRDMQKEGQNRYWMRLLVGDVGYNGEDKVISHAIAIFKEAVMDGKAKAAVLVPTADSPPATTLRNFVLTIFWLSVYVGCGFTRSIPK